MGVRRKTRWLAVGAAVAAVKVALYVRWIRPWQMHWGATAEETARPLPGDEIVARPTWNATRAVTVEARPEHIWPFLVQIGWGRAGGGTATTGPTTGSGRAPGTSWRSTSTWRSARSSP